VEFDDTPGSERISINHRSGSFEEYHPNGDKVTKVVRDNYTSILRDAHVHVDGYANITIDKALKILVNKDELKSDEKEAVNYDIHIGKNANVNIYIEKGNLNVLVDEGDSNIQLKKGDVNIRQDCGNYNHFINGDYNLECTGHMHVVVGEDQVTEVGRNRDVRIDGLFDNLQLTNKESVKETTLAGDKRTQVKGHIQEHIDKITERKYGDSVTELYKNAASRTYLGSYTVERHLALGIGVGSGIGGGSDLRAGELSIYAGKSAIRTDLDNYLISGEGNVGMQGFNNVFIDAGIVENRRNPGASLKIYSENVSFFGAKKNTNIFARENLALTAVKELSLHAGSKILKNKEFEEGAPFKINETLYNPDVNIAPDPRKPVDFINCPSAKWTPTREKGKCKNIKQE
jgi:hypothetical protein